MLLLLRGSSCRESVSVSGSRFVVDLTLSNAARFHNPIVFKITVYFFFWALTIFMFFGRFLRGWGEFSLSHKFWENSQEMLKKLIPNMPG